MSDNYRFWKIQQTDDEQFVVITENNGDSVDAINLIADHPTPEKLSCHEWFPQGQQRERLIREYETGVDDGWY